MGTKKKLLFICGNMNIGGVQKSLLSLLSLLDYEKYEVDLLLLQREGIFLDYIPKEVRLLDETGLRKEDVYHVTSLVKNMRKLPLRVIARIGAGVIYRFNRNLSAVVESKSIQRVDKQYDVCIDYGGQQLLYYMVDRVKAHKKISYFHNDYSKYPYYEQADRKYYHNVDNIITVSNQCVEVMKQYFPEHAHKIDCIHNISSRRTIEIYKENKNPYPQTNKLIFVSIGRVCHDKGNDMAIEVARMLKEAGLEFTWYVVGPTVNEQEEQYYRELIKENGVQEEYILLGGTHNPYDYIEYADYIIHPARFEGKPVALDEAQILGKIIIATEFSTVHDQLTHGVDAIVTPMNSESIARGVLELVDNKELQKKLLSNLGSKKNGNEYELEKFNKLINP